MTATYHYDPSSQDALTSTGSETRDAVNTRAADSQSLADGGDFREGDRQGWQDVIDEKLIDWGRNPKELEDEDLIPPTLISIQASSRLAMDLRDQGAPPPRRVVPNGDGGIVLERWVGKTAWTLEVFDDGSIEYACYDDCRLVQRQRVG
jgi:hypothetical protein